MPTNCLIPKFALSFSHFHRSPFSSPGQRKVPPQVSWVLRSMPDHGDQALLSMAAQKNEGVHVIADRELGKTGLPMKIL